jgi:hypothetical protein
MPKMFTVLYKGTTFRIGVLNPGTHDYNGCINVIKLDGTMNHYWDPNKNESGKFLKNPKRYIRKKMRSWLNFIITDNPNQWNPFDYGFLNKVLILEE